MSGRSDEKRIERTGHHEDSRGDDVEVPRDEIQSDQSDGNDANVAATDIKTSVDQPTKVPVEDDDSDTEFFIGEDESNENTTATINPQATASPLADSANNEPAPDTKPPPPPSSGISSAALAAIAAAQKEAEAMLAQETKQGRSSNERPKKEKKKKKDKDGSKKAKKKKKEKRSKAEE